MEIIHVSAIGDSIRRYDQYGREDNFKLAIFYFPQQNKITDSSWVQFYHPGETEKIQ